MSTNETHLAGRAPELAGVVDVFWLVTIAFLLLRLVR